jgi:trans-aconitate methyltransferase
MEDATYWKNRKIDDPRRDWRTGEKDWVEEYKASVSHPHRKLILKALKELEPFNSVLELGCNCGPNLSLIQKKYPKAKLIGMDINEDAISLGSKSLPNVNFIRCRIEDVATLQCWLSEIGLHHWEFDVILADATLMYVHNIERMMYFIALCAKSVIIVDWKSKGKKYGHYTRDYGAMLKKYYQNVKEIKLTKKDWPNDKWAELGHLWIAK